MDARTVLRKVTTRVLPNLHHLPKSQIRRCRACSRPSAFICIQDCDEFRFCVRCGANLRYELLAQAIRTFDLPRIDVLELDFASPLHKLLSQARSYTRSFWRPDVAPGTIRADGVVCQDITRLTFPDASLDLIVSSDVLEHVPDMAAAFAETARVLRPGGAHLFTVPVRPLTRRRAEIRDGEVTHLLEPEYHHDPLDRRGVLTFWDFGPDLPRYMPSGLHLRVIAGPEGEAGRFVWAAQRA